MLAIALIAGALVCGCELPGPTVQVKAHAVANVRPLYQRMVVLFRFYRNGENVHEATSPVTAAPSESSYDVALGPGGELGVAVAVYWDEGGGNYVEVTSTQARQLTYSEAREAAQGGGTHTWRVDMDFTVGE